MLRNTCIWAGIVILMISSVADSNGVVSNAQFPPVLTYQGRTVALQTNREGVSVGGIQGTWSELMKFFDEELIHYSLTHAQWTLINSDLIKLQFAILKSNRQPERAEAQAKNTSFADIPSIFDAVRDKDHAQPECRAPFPLPVRVVAVLPETGKTTVQTAHGLQNLYIKDFIAQTDWQLVKLTIDFIYFSSVQTDCEPVTISVNQVANVR